MSKSTETPLKSPTGAESPTTVRPLELDDDDVQDSAALAHDAPGQKNAPVEETPPAKPPRPLSPQQQAENTLKDAFPSIDAAVVRAVLTASGGRIEPAFNALLGMSDPDAAREQTPPPQPPRPVAAPRVGATPQSQLEADEQYARQLAEHYSGGYGPRTSSRSHNAAQRDRQPVKKPSDDPYGENHSFLEDELPIIKENIRKGFLETQTTVNSWIQTLKKKIDGEDEEDDEEDRRRQKYNSGASQQYRGRRSNDGRRSGDYNRYDADPQVLSDDFAGIQLNNDGSASQQRRSTRPLANPDLFKPTPSPPKSNDSRKVAFQNSPPEDMDLYRSSPKVTTKDTVPSGGKQSKWQPLSTVEPSPIGDNDNDPFSLGDSEDEKESKDRVGGKEIKQDDAERLKKAAAEAMNDSIGEPARKLDSAETVGSKDKVTEQKLGGKS